MFGYVSPNILSERVLTADNKVGGSGNKLKGGVQSGLYL
jgi:hypothetical protein